MTNDEAIAELKSIAALFGKAGRKADSKLPKSKENEKDGLKELLAYLRVCAQYTLFEKEAQDREHREHISELKVECGALKAKIKELGGTLSE